jgi:glutamine synthetase
MTSELNPRQLEALIRELDKKIEHVWRKMEPLQIHLDTLVHERAEAQQELDAFYTEEHLV